MSRGPATYATRALVLATVLLAGGCSAFERPSRTVPAPCIAPQTPYVRHELYFGLGVVGTPGAITDDAWRAFAEDVLTRSFPAGLTVLEGHGEWRADDGTLYRERTRVAIHLAPLEDDGRAAEAVAAVIAEAKSRLVQQSVLWQSSIVCAAF